MGEAGAPPGYCLTPRVALEWPHARTDPPMTGDQSRSLKPGERVCWGAMTTGYGTVIATSWSEVTISWDDGETNSVSHNDMAKVERVLGK
jgi:hypothetical protein